MPWTARVTITDYQEVTEFGEWVKGFSNCYLHSYRRLEMELHKIFLKHLKVFFQKRAYEALLEYPQEYSFIRRKDCVRVTRHGYIDLVARKSDSKVAVEYDSASLLKHSSIIKLLFSESDCCFGIVSGRIESPDLIDENLRRIDRKVAAQKVSVCASTNPRDFYFIEMQPWTMRRIDIRARNRKQRSSP